MDIHRNAALGPAGRLALVEAIELGAAVCLLVIPLAAILAVLSREREARIGQAVELSDAYQGTAMLLGDVVEADDAYAGSHSRGVVELSLAVAERLGLDSRQRRNVEFAALLLRACAGTQFDPRVAGILVAISQAER